GHATADGFLTSLYHDVLGRDIDPAGESGFKAFLAQGQSHTVVAMLVAGSPEARAVEVRDFYETFLDRSASNVEIQAWALALQQGVPEDVAAATFIGSTEYFDQFIRPETRVPSQLAQAVPGQAGQLVSTTFTITSRETAFNNE